MFGVCELEIGIEQLSESIDNGVCRRVSRRAKKKKKQKARKLIKFERWEALRRAEDRRAGNVWYIIRGGYAKPSGRIGDSRWNDEKSEIQTRAVFIQPSYLVSDVAVFNIFLRVWRARIVYRRKNRVI